MGLVIENESKHDTVDESLKVSVCAMDLRNSQYPILCGHYAQDPIAGPESLIDQFVLDGLLKRRYQLGLYPATLGSHLVELLEPNSEQKSRGSLHGAIIIGLGVWGELTPSDIRRTVEAAVKEYLLTLASNPTIIPSKKIGEEPSLGVPLSSLLIGHNSMAHISAAASVNAITEGVMSANRAIQSSMKEPTFYVDELQFIEHYLDTAITAAHALDALKKEDKRIISLGLSNSRNIRPRLRSTVNQGYWPRLIVTRNSDPLDESGDSQSASAGRLKYLFFSERARAESVEHQHQTELFEHLFNTSIQNAHFDEESVDAGKLLYQYLVPRDFKGFLANNSNLILALDEYTADYPWEMMINAGKPLVTTQQLIRQFVTSEYDKDHKVSRENLAFVIGDPSTDGFYGADAKHSSLSKLPGAKKEASAISSLLNELDFNVFPKNSQSRLKSVPILVDMHERNYRVLVVAAHGVVNHIAKNGDAKTGVVLSDGVILTAAEIGSMSEVPEVVFLNCCHIGEIDNRNVEYNQLAKSISRELIELGVRCIIAAGWAVDDAAALTFSKTFFKALLHHKKSFATAVTDARKKTYAKHRATNTWGAYQAYGDPDFVLEVKSEKKKKQTVHPLMVSVHEMQDAITRLRAENQYGCSLKPDEIENTLALLFDNTQPEWQQDPVVLHEIARLYSESGPKGFEKSIEYYHQAIVRQSKDDDVPISAIEQLANLEARLGSQIGTYDPEKGMSLIKQAIHRIRSLDASILLDDTGSNVERSGILASAYKHKASILLLDPENNWNSVKVALSQCCECYLNAEESEENLLSNILYPVINRLQLQALISDDKVILENNVTAANVCRALALDNFRESHDFFDAVMSADAYLARELNLGGLVSQDEAREVLTVYKESITKIPYSHQQMNSVVKQLELLASFLCSRNGTDDDLRSGNLYWIAQGLAPEPAYQ